LKAFVMDWNAFPKNPLLLGLPLALRTCETVVALVVTGAVAGVTVAAALGVAAGKTVDLLVVVVLVAVEPGPLVGVEFVLCGVGLFNSELSCWIAAFCELPTLLSRLDVVVVDAGVVLVLVDVGVEVELCGVGVEATLLLFWIAATIPAGNEGRTVEVVFGATSNSVRTGKKLPEGGWLRCTPKFAGESPRYLATALFGTN
jgi:hypothetical protein